MKILESGLTQKTTISQVYGYNNPDFSYQPTFQGVPIGGGGITVYGSFYNIPASEADIQNAIIPLNYTYSAQGITLETSGVNTGKLLITEPGKYFVVFSTNCVRLETTACVINLRKNNIPDAKYSVNQNVYQYFAGPETVTTDPCDFAKTLSFFADYSENDLLSFYVTGSIRIEENKGPQISITLMKIADLV